MGFPFLSGQKRDRLEDYSLGERDIFDLYDESRGFRNAVDSGKFILVDGKVCRKDRESVTFKDGTASVSEKALSNPRRYLFRIIPAFSAFFLKGYAEGKPTPVEEVGKRAKVGDGTNKLPSIFERYPYLAFPGYENDNQHDHTVAESFTVPEPSNSDTDFHGYPDLEFSDALDESAETEKLESYLREEYRKKIKMPVRKRREEEEKLASTAPLPFEDVEKHFRRNGEGRQASPFFDLHYEDASVASIQALHGHLDPGPVSTPPTIPRERHPKKDSKKLTEQFFAYCDGDEKNYTSFGDQLSQMMDDCDVTKEELAEEIGVSPRTIQRMRTGVREPSLREIVAICIGLQLLPWQSNVLLQAAGRVLRSGKAFSEERMFSFFINYAYNSKTVEECNGFMKAHHMKPLTAKEPFEFDLNDF